MKITLDQALPFVRSLEQKLIPLGAHCALGGSVLHSGESNKDLDIFVYPNSQETSRTPEELIEILRTLFPEGYTATDKMYPYDRLRYVLMHEIGKVEFFVFLTEQPVVPILMGRG